MIINLLKTEKSKIIFLMLGVLTCINFFMLFELPVFPDEINWRFTHTRAIIDNFYNYSYFKPCYLGAIEIPKFLTPQFSFLSIFFYFDNSFSYRFFPLTGYVLLFIPLYAYLIKNKNQKNILFLSFIFFIFTSLGNAGSIWLATSRAEFLIYYFLFFVFVSQTKYKNLFFLIVIMFFWSVAATAHPKFLYFILVPIYLISVYKINLYIKFILLLYLFVFSFLCISVNNEIYFSFCDNFFPIFYDWMSKFNVNPLLVFTDFKQFFIDFFSGFYSHLNNLFHRAPNHLFFLPERQAPFLPNIKLNFLISLSNFTILFFYYFNFVLGILFFINHLTNSLKIKSFLINNQLEMTILLVYFVIFVLILFNRTTNAYEVNLWITIISFLNIFSFINFYSKFKSGSSYKLFVSSINRVINFLNYIFLIFFIISTILFFKYYYLYFIDSNKSSWAGMSVPIKYFNNDTIADMRRNFYDSCFVDKEHTLFLFDDHTYNALKYLKGSKISPVTYTMLPYYRNSSLKLGQQKLDKFFEENYENVVFYGSCGFEKELPGSFKRKSSLERLDLCCLAR